MGLFVVTNVKENTDAVCVTMAEERSILEEEDELVLVVRENLEELVLNITTDDYEAVIDCACPTTVTGIGWINRFYDALDEESKKQVVKMKSIKMYKFGGGEKRQSMAKVIFPCNIAGKNVKVTTEVVDTEFPLLFGNTAMKAARGVLYWTERQVRMLGSMIPCRETSSGHYSIQIEPPMKNISFEKTSKSNSREEEESVIPCLLAKVQTLTFKDFKHLHHSFGHCKMKRIGELIKNANKMTPEVSRYIKKIEEECQTCKGIRSLDLYQIPRCQELQCLTKCSH